MRGQIDSAADNENDAVREVRRECDRAENEVLRLRERATELELKEEITSARLKSQEKEILKGTEALFKKERALKEETLRIEVVQSSIAELRMEHDDELTKLTAALNRERMESLERKEKHRRETEEIKTEVSEKIPRMLTAAIERVENQWHQRLQKELSDCKGEYEYRIERMKQEHLEGQASRAESEARQRLNHADEKVF
jgi:hypothetical protein